MQQKINLKSLNEKCQELRMLFMGNKSFNQSSPILKPVLYMVSELFVKAFHATLQSFSYGDAMWSTNMVAGNQ